MAEQDHKETARFLREHMPDDPMSSIDPFKTMLSSGQAIPIPDGKRRISHPGVPRLNTVRVDPVSGDEIPKLDEPSAPVDATPQAVSFALLDIVGRGGFGEVWEALQISLGRVVAVKRLRDDLFERKGSDPAASQWLEVSFRQEAVVTARLEHPNIVPVHDFGLDEEGRNLLAMKLVKGTPWSDLLQLDFHSMAVDEYLARHLPILIQVSQAVAFAHSRGVVHRDLKPSQVMVGEFGEVLLMDWGLAVVFNAGALLDTQFGTKAGELPLTEYASSPAGTAAFMAPEQTEMHARGVGPWTDVFLLGSTLYYVLTLKPPHAGSSTTEVFLNAINGVIMSIEEAAAGREIPEELKDLAAHAMQRRPSDRVESARVYIERLQDYLSGASRKRMSRAITKEAETRLRDRSRDYKDFSEVLASLSEAQALWPGNPLIPALSHNALIGYAKKALAEGDLRLARQQVDRMEDEEDRAPWMQRILEGEARAREKERTRRIAVAASFVLLVLLVGVGGFSALRQKTLRKEAEFERDRAEAASRESEQKRLEASRARGESEQLVRFMLSDLRESVILLQSLTVAHRQQLLDKVAGRVMDHYSDVITADLPEEELKQIHQGLIDVGHLLLIQGNVSKADQAFDISLNLALKVSETSVSEGGWQAELAQSYASKGDALRYGGDLDKALKYYHDSFEHHTVRLNQSPGDPMLLRNLGKCFAQMADVMYAKGQVKMALFSYEKAASNIREALKKDPMSSSWRRDLAGILKTHGSILCKHGTIEEALAALRESHELYVALGQEKPLDDEALRDLASSHGFLGRALQQQGNQDDAMKEYEQANNILKKLLDIDPTNTQWQQDLANNEECIGLVHQDRGNTEEALACFTRNREVFEALTARDPNNMVFQRSLAEAYDRTGDFHVGRNRNDEAESQFARALAIRRDLIAHDPQNWQWQAELTMSLDRMAHVEVNTGRNEEAEETLRELISIVSELLKRDSKNVEWQSGLAHAQIRLASLYVSQKRFPEAVNELESGQEVLEGLAARNPKDSEIKRELAACIGLLGNLYNRQRNLPAALEQFRRMSELMDELTELNPKNVDWQVGRAIAHQSLGEALARSDKHAESIVEQHAAIGILDQVIAGEPLNPVFRRYRFASMRGIALSMRELGQLEKGVEFVNETLAEVSRTEKEVESYQEMSEQDRTTFLVTRASMLLLLKDTDGAFASLEEALDAGLKSDNALENMERWKPLQEADPERMQRIMKRLADQENPAPSSMPLSGS